MPRHRSWRQRPHRDPASVPYDVQAEAERAIEEDCEFAAYLRENKLTLDDYVEAVGEDRSALCDERWEAC